MKFKCDFSWQVQRFVVQSRTGEWYFVVRSSTGVVLSSTSSTGVVLCSAE